VAGAFAYLLIAHLDGWRAFCRELHLAPDHLMGLIPAYQTVAELERTARAMCCTEAELKVFGGAGAEGKREVVTAETVLRALREALNALCG
jgi:hypothetical protein